MRWNGVTGVLGSYMPDFTYTCDPNNTNNFFIRGWKKPSEWFCTTEQGIHLAKEVLFEGKNRIQHPLIENTPSNMSLDGLLQLTNACLVGSKGHLNGDIDGDFTIVDSQTDVEIVSVFFKWYINSPFLVRNVVFNQNQDILDKYFTGIKFGLPRQMEYVLKDFEYWLPQSVLFLLQESGYECKVPVIESVLHVETDWDVLS